MEKLHLDIPIFCKGFVTELENTLPFTDIELKQFRDAVMDTAKELEMTHHEVGQARRKYTLDNEELLRYFRSRERNRITAHVLEYLVSFLDGLPGDCSGNNELVNPCIQFHSMVSDLVSQMDAPDARETVLKVLDGRGRITEGNNWYYIGRMDQVSSQLRESLKKSQEPSRANWTTLFMVVSEFSRFWFCVRNGDPKRIRKSDMYIYQLAVLLCKSMQAQK